MSRSKRDQRGKRIAGEIGRDPAIIGDQVRNDFGWDSIGSPAGKRSRKREAARLRRLVDKDVTKNELEKISDEA